MNCPKCGLQAPPDQKFCRSCGASVQIDTQPLVGHVPVTGWVESSAIKGKDEIPLAYRSVLWAFAVTFTGVAIGVIGKMLLHVETVTVIGSTAFVGGYVFCGLSVFGSTPSYKTSHCSFSIAGNPIPGRTNTTSAASERYR